MADAPSIQLDLQDDLAARCRADTYLSAHTIIRDDVQDVETEIAKALSEINSESGIKPGICIIVRQPTCRDANANVPLGPMEVEVTVRVIENVLLNRAAEGTQRKGLSVARRIVDVLKLYQPVGLATPLVCARPAIESVFSMDEAIAIDVKFHAREAASRNQFKAASPTFTVSGSVTLACQTEPVDIYYTLDGSHPYAGNPAATRYDGAFTPPYSCLIRACAYRQQSGYDWIASDVNAVWFDAELAENTENPLGTAEGETIGA